VARYTINAINAQGELKLLEHLTLDEALHEAVELKDDGFRHIILTNTETGAEVADLEELMRGWKPGTEGPA
jgi:hypothetical protein